VVHPDALFDMSLWREFGAGLCVENMDKRKPIGRSAKELDRVFKQLPDATLCFDIGHARQCDPTMTEAYLILREFGTKLRQVHVSEVNTQSKHDRLSFGSILAFQEIAHLLPEDLPLILETPVDETDIAEEINTVREALPVGRQKMVA
jgi:sugar phosphate isomerase/epimerase